ncbi:MAG: UvrD-helicase domain-containing protein [Oleispira sp.]|nr:UvrD-helicase domain-containing protein [Oleispira sp.]
MDYQSFVDSNKSLLISPAGYGKTHAIVESLKYTSGRQLILTHTHAGVASIKDKIIKAKITPDRYAVETISSFSQRYLKSFYSGSDVPDQDAKDKNNPLKDYHSFITEKARALISSNMVRRILLATYDGLFVDEYQDCSKLQHGFLMALSNILPTRILGDPLQGIFDFNGEIIDFKTDLPDFEQFPDLQTPYRWHKEGNNRGLGDLIKTYRQPLIEGGVINLCQDSQRSFYVIQVEDGDFDDPHSVYRQKIKGLLQHSKSDNSYESLLIIVPEYNEIVKGNTVRRGGIDDRAKMLATFDYAKEVTLLEAIDDSKFYSLAKGADKIISSIPRARKPIKNIYNFLANFFLKTSPKNRKNIGLNDWIAKSSRTRDDDYYLKSKQADAADLGQELASIISKLETTPSHTAMYSLLLFLKSTLRLKIKPRKELLNSLLQALNKSVSESISVYDAMKEHKNTIRRVGRKVQGKCMGTTLLTKGLEFDTVVIMDAHKFESPKHLYVALTRCCKNLVIFTKGSQLGPFNVHSRSELVTNKMTKETSGVNLKLKSSSVSGSFDKFHEQSINISQQLSTSANEPRYAVITQLFPLLRSYGYRRAHEMASIIVRSKFPEIGEILRRFS